VVGDVGRADKLLEYVRGADAMVIEATYLTEEAEMAATYGHSTAEEVARLAQEADVKKLILTHVSRRYRDEEILEEAQSIFPNSWVARDFDNFQIKRS
jgi:ribonuclease Z